MENKNRDERAWLLKQALREVMAEFGFGDEERRKAIVKEAISEWLDAKLKQYRRRSLDWLLAVLVAGVAILIFVKLVKGGP